MFLECMKNIEVRI